MALKASGVNRISNDAISLLHAGKEFSEEARKALIELVSGLSEKGAYECKIDLDSLRDTFSRAHLAIENGRANAHKFAETKESLELHELAATAYENLSNIVDFSFRLIHGEDPAISSPELMNLAISNSCVALLSSLKKIGDIGKTIDVVPEDGGIKHYEDLISGFLGDKDKRLSLNQDLNSKLEVVEKDAPSLPVRQNIAHPSVVATVCSSTNCEPEKILLLESRTVILPDGTCKKIDSKLESYGVSSLAKPNHMSIIELEYPFSASGKYSCPRGFKVCGIKYKNSQMSEKLFEVTHRSSGQVNISGIPREAASLKITFHPVVQHKSLTDSVRKDLSGKAYFKLIVPKNVGNLINKLHNDRTLTDSEKSMAISREFFAKELVYTIDPSVGKLLKGLPTGIQLSFLNALGVGDCRTFSLQLHALLSSAGILSAVEGGPSYNWPINAYVTPGHAQLKCLVKPEVTIDPTIHVSNDLEYIPPGEAILKSYAERLQNASEDGAYEIGLELRRLSVNRASAEKNSHEQGHNLNDDYKAPSEEKLFKALEAPDKLLLIAQLLNLYKKSLAKGDIGQLEITYLSIVNSTQKYFHKFGDDIENLVKDDVFKAFVSVMKGILSSEEIIRKDKNRVVHFLLGLHNTVFQPTQFIELCVAVVDKSNISILASNQRFISILHYCFIESDSISKFIQKLMSLSVDSVNKSEIDSRNYANLAVACHNALEDLNEPHKTEASHAIKHSIWETHVPPVYYYTSPFYYLGEVEQASFRDLLEKRFPGFDLSELATLALVWDEYLRANCKATSKKELDLLTLMLTFSKRIPENAKQNLKVIFDDILETNVEFFDTYNPLCSEEAKIVTKIGALADLPLDRLVYTRARKVMELEEAGLLSKELIERLLPSLSKKEIFNALCEGLMATREPVDYRIFSRDNILNPIGQALLALMKNGIRFKDLDKMTLSVMDTVYKDSLDEKYDNLVKDFENEYMEEFDRLCAFFSGLQNVIVEYAIDKYLPKNTPSFASLNVLENLIASSTDLNPKNITPEKPCELLENYKVHFGAINPLIKGKPPQSGMEMALKILTVAQETIRMKNKLSDPFDVSFRNFKGVLGWYQSYLRLPVSEATFKAKKRSLMISALFYAVHNPSLVSPDVANIIHTKPIPNFKLRERTNASSKRNFKAPGAQSHETYGKALQFRSPIRTDDLNGLREYQIGDDIRSLDNNALARYDKLFVRQHHQKTKPEPGEYELIVDGAFLANDDFSIERLWSDLRQMISDGKKPNLSIFLFGACIERYSYAELLEFKASDIVRIRAAFMDFNSSLKILTQPDGELLNHCHSEFIIHSDEVSDIYKRCREEKRAIIVYGIKKNAKNFQETRTKLLNDAAKSGIIAGTIDI
jgi:hypothetical protein